MEDVNCWQSKFTPCQYSDKLLNKLNLLNKQVGSPVDISEITKAIYYARKYHGSQMRKSGELYYSHPIEVAYLFAEHVAIKEPQYFKTDLIVTALLHDTIEDTKLTKDMISKIFNEQIADQVYDLTRVKEDGHKISAGEIIEQLLIEKKYGILLIKQFDRIHNAETLGVKSPEKVKKIIDETIKYFVKISIYYETAEIENILTDLCYKYLPITELKSPNSIKSRLDNYLLPSLTFQNELNQKHILHLLEL